MVAPTPVSGLLHAVAVVKSGVFGIARTVLDVYGPATVGDLGVGIVLATVAGATILIASIIALRQDNLKRRLAYSTISQLSYIVLGLGLLSPAALIGGLLHIPAHAFMKLTLFFCAGAIHVETHTDNISEMAGIGRRMPLTMAAFGVAALGMAGLPLVAGFVSKWYLLIGSVESGGVGGVFALVLLTSGILNIGYFWPVVYQAFFETQNNADSKPVIEFNMGGRTAHTDGGTESENSMTASPVSESNTNQPESPGSHAGSSNYAVDRHPSDHHAESADDASSHMEGTRAWKEPALGNESTWFMLGPIAIAAFGAILIGILPAEMIFLRLINIIVAGVTGVSL
jgi:NADH-quinone oxidoreductase subunit L/multicomponent Na+:H+ antiporter subunit D